jgi:hypothetical protein
MLNFVYLRSSRLHFPIFWLDSCIVNKGEKFRHVLACCMHLEGFQVVSSYFWARAVPRWSSAWPVSSTGLTSVSSQVLGDLVHRFDRWGRPVWPVRVRLKQLLCFVMWFACIRLGGIALVQGELACVQGSTLWFSNFSLVVCALCLIMVLSWMCQLFALA